MAEKETSRKNIVVEGTLIKARREKKSFKGNEVNKFNLTVSDILNMYAGNIIETFDSTQYYYVENYVIKVKEL